MTRTKRRKEEMKRQLISGVLCLSVILGGAALASAKDENNAAAKNDAKTATKAPLTLVARQAAHLLEVNNNARYVAFAKKADEEGYKSVAVMFRALAQSEKMRAEKHAGLIKTLGGTINEVADKVEAKTTKENLEAANKMETTDKEALYTGYAKTAETEKNEHAAMTFKGAVAIGASNAKMIKQALSELDAWKAGDREFYVCTVCTYVSMDPKLLKCPVCQAPKSKFDTIK